MHELINGIIYFICCLSIAVFGMCLASSLATWARVRLLSRESPEEEYFRGQVAENRPFGELSDSEIIQEIDQATTDMFDQDETETHRWSASVTRQALNATLGIRQRERAN